MKGADPSGFDPAEAFRGATQQFLGLLQSLGVGPAAAGEAPWNPTVLTASLANQFEQWLRQQAHLFPGVPGLPGGREWQPDAQRLWELLQRLATLQAQLTPYWSEIAAEAARRFGARLGAVTQPPALEEALRLYERWVECAEGAYAATVRQEDFCRLQAQLVNTCAELLAWQRRQADALVQSFGLPSRAEFESLRTQVQALRAQRSRTAKPRRPAAAGRGAGKRGARRPRARGARARR